MAAVLGLCLVVLAVLGRGMSMPKHDGDRPSAAALADYLDKQQGLVKQGLVEVPDWPSADVKFGQVSGVDVTPKGGIIVFHRGDRPWAEGTFDEETNVMPEEQRINISQNAIVLLHPRTGEELKSFGADRFYIPHGVTVDRKGNVWLTDVGTHQVYKIPHGQTEPDQEFGVKFEPGSDDHHFCKPTDVAVASNGDFFVADGYCNSRVIKFSKAGLLLGKFGMNIVGYGVDSPYSFNVPHNLALIEDLDIICVADRDNERVLCFNAGLKGSKLGQFNRTIVPGSEIGRTFGIAYDPNEDLMYVAGLLSEEPVWNKGYSYTPARAFTYDMAGNYLGGWAYITPREAQNGPSIPHDIAVSPDGNDVYIADLTQQTVRKFTKPPYDRRYFG